LQSWGLACSKNSKVLDMAKKTLRVIYLFLSILLFCELIDEAQGSRLRCHHSQDYPCKKRSSHHHHHNHHFHHHYHHHHKDTPNESKDLQRSIKTRRSKVFYGVDAFRPTAPGHSPGVGHSIKT
ncbi:precursor of CEP11, partial [Eutrema salsugineum]|uniref:precursor of CEP11 n=1 Tax=Eutrema salsugineum TaxID=72664 RepID=UPI000CECF960